MPTYVYETIPEKPGDEPKIYEFQQSMKDEPLKTHPETGETIRRVVLGGFGVLSSKSSAKENRKGECGPGCCCG